MSTLGIVLISITGGLGILVIILGICVFRPHLVKLKDCVLRKFSKSSKNEAEVGQAQPFPLVPPDFNNAEDIEISLRSSRASLHEQQSIPVKTESENVFESHIDFGTSPINFNDPPLEHPPI